MTAMAVVIPAAGLTLLLGMYRLEARLLRPGPAHRPVPDQPVVRQAPIRSQPPAGDPPQTTPKRSISAVTRPDADHSARSYVHSPVVVYGSPAPTTVISSDRQDHRPAMMPNPTITAVCPRVPGPVSGARVVRSPRGPAGTGHLGFHDAVPLAGS